MVERMISILGTNHLMKKEEIYSMIKKEHPDIIAVELCATRYELMVRPLFDNYIDNKPKIKDESVLGKISDTIKQKAEQENVQYSSDQINACLYAREKDIQLEFVDLDITKTKELMDKIPENEKKEFLNQLAEFQKKGLIEQTKNINVEENLKLLKEKFPIAFEFLINMRNLVIINNILKLKIKYPNKKILVILGKGHVNVVEDALK